jgi:hypothetical protein
MLAGLPYPHMAVWTTDDSQHRASCLMFADWVVKWLEQTGGFDVDYNNLIAAI